MRQLGFFALVLLVFPAFAWADVERVARVTQATHQLLLEALKSPRVPNRDKEALLSEWERIYRTDQRTSEECAKLGNALIQLRESMRRKKEGLEARDRFLGKISERLNRELEGLVAIHSRINSLINDHNATISQARTQAQADAYNRRSEHLNMEIRAIRVRIDAHHRVVDGHNQQVQANKAEVEAYNNRELPSLEVARRRVLSCLENNEMLVVSPAQGLSNRIREVLSAASKSTRVVVTVRSSPSRPVPAPWRREPVSTEGPGARPSPPDQTPAVRSPADRVERYQRVMPKLRKRIEQLERRAEELSRDPDPEKRARGERFRDRAKRYREREERFLRRMEELRKQAAERVAQGPAQPTGEQQPATGGPAQPRPGAPATKPQPPPSIPPPKAPAPSSPSRDPARRQAEVAAQGQAQADHVFDGRKDPPDAVDVRGVNPWKKGEREQELKKPPSQLPERLRRPTPEPPPPPARAAQTSPTAEAGTGSATLEHAARLAREAAERAARLAREGGEKATQAAQQALDQARKAAEDRLRALREALADTATRRTPPSKEPGKTEVTPAPPTAGKPAPLAAPAGASQLATVTKPASASEPASAPKPSVATKPPAPVPKEVSGRQKETPAALKEAPAKGLAAKVVEGAIALGRSLKDSALASAERAADLGRALGRGLATVVRDSTTPARDLGRALALGMREADPSRWEKAADTARAVGQAVRAYGGNVLASAAETGKAVGLALRDLERRWVSDAATVGKSVAQALTESGGAWLTKASEAGQALGSAVRTATRLAVSDLTTRARAVGSAVAGLVTGGQDAPAWTKDGLELLRAAGRGLKEVAGSAAGLAVPDLGPATEVAVALVQEAVARGRGVRLPSREHIARSLEDFHKVLRGKPAEDTQRASVDILWGMGEGARALVVAGGDLLVGGARAAWDAAQYARLGVHYLATGDAAPLRSYQPYSLIVRLAAEGKLGEVVVGAVRATPEMIRQAEAAVVGWWRDITSGEQERIDRARVQLGRGLFEVATVVAPALVGSKAGKVAQAGEVLAGGKAGEVARAGEVVSGAKVGEAAKAGEVAAGAERAPGLAPKAQAAATEMQPVRPVRKLAAPLDAGQSAQLREFAAGAGLKPEIIDVVMEVGKKEGVEIVVRPVGPRAIELWQKGHRPKPKRVPVMTANELDLELLWRSERRGALGVAKREDLLGQTVYFRPSLPEVLPADLEKRAKLLQRYADRMQEHERFQKTIKKLRREGKIVMGRDPIVRDPRRRLGYASDLDLYDFRPTGGQKLTLVQKKELCRKVTVALRVALRARLAAELRVVTHEPFACWDLSTIGEAGEREAAEETFKRVLKRHLEGPEGEPVKVIRPDGKLGEEWADPKALPFQPAAPPSSRLPGSLAPIVPVARWAPPYLREPSGAIKAVGSWEPGLRPARALTRARRVPSHPRLVQARLTFSVAA